ncbi:hypothetical protein I6G82_02875 [Lysinibacillus macroides]|uniref:Uncharacterized protein n=1 Tax=Lysinibacillus macroides TaxID=33935 RepID=A0A0M9DJ56_9BACI|nr:hypothetical protein [Lysinibacillus macroides]KOY81252.1 hypothetical protein ADM90_19110 [Lysinibacillus macroides]QPR68592.1 hypothetical protein I6G82_02875 [Lysinibacillus macroides]
MSKKCEACGLYLTDHNTRKMIGETKQLLLCVSCYDGVKDLVGKPREVVKQELERLKGVPPKKSRLQSIKKWFKEKGR